MTLRLGSAAPPAAPPQEPAGKTAPAGGFGDPRRGDVPEGAAELITPETERAIETGLAWLAGTQNADGSFGNGTYRGNIAVTSLAGLAFMAVGLEPGPRPLRHRRSTRPCVYVMDNTSPSGFIAVAAAATHGPMYSHGFGTLFLAEAYGMTHRPEIREKLQKAVRLIIDTQNNEGGWRYQPVRRDADLSVTDLPDQRPPRRPERRASSSPRRRSTTASATSSSRRTPTAASATCSRGAPAPSRGRPPGVVALYSAAVYDAKEIEAGVAYLQAVHARDQARQPLQPLLLRPLLRRPGHVDPRRRRLERLVSRRSATSWSAASRRPPGFWNDSICNEYGTAMALIILQMPNNYLPIFQR